MYNKCQKKEYLDYAKEDYWKYLFANTEYYEQELKKDLCDMDTAELTRYLMTLGTVTNLRVMRNRICRYIDWCVIKGYAGFNWISPKVLPNDVLFETFNQLNKALYISSEKYCEYRNKLMDSSYSIYITSVFMALYEGFDYMELAQFRVSGLNCRKHTINVYGQDYKISEGLTRALLETSKVTRVESRTKTIQYSYSLYPDSVWKNRKPNITVDTMVRQFRFLLDEMKKILEEPGLNRTVIRNSGFFNKIYYRALEDKIDLRSLDFSPDKAGMELNRSFEHYFADSKVNNMNMRHFIRSFSSYLQQV